jgi:hypothetical protein
MTITTLRAAIAGRAQDLRVAALVSVGVVHHKKGWRNCPCSWCEKKREATLVIGSVPGEWRQSGQYVDDLRHIWRDDMRVKYRAAMAQLEGAWHG